MKTLVRPADTLSELREAMAGKKTTTDKPGPVHQMSVRIPDVDFRRIEAAAARLGLDPTSLIRMMIKENLATYERRAEQIQ